MRAKDCKGEIIFVWFIFCNMVHYITLKTTYFFLSCFLILSGSMTSAGHTPIHLSMGVIQPKHPLRNGIQYSLTVISASWHNSNLMMNMKQK
jgi:hypothetical protein